MRVRMCTGICRTGLRPSVAAFGQARGRGPRPEAGAPGRPSSSPTAEGFVEAARLAAPGRAAAAARAFSAGNGFLPGQLVDRLL